MAEHGKAAKPEPTKASVRALEVSAGSEYLTSVFYHIVRDGHGHNGGGNGNSAKQRRSPGAGAGASAVGIEHIPTLTVLVLRNIHADGLSNGLDLQGIALITGDS
jgi:hypothetical protein